MKKLLNSIAINFWGCIPFKDVYEYPKQKVNFRGFIHMDVDRISTDSRTFKNHTNDRKYSSVRQ